MSNPEWMRRAYAALKLVSSGGASALTDLSATDYVRQLEDALLIMWGELPAEQTIELRRERPSLMDFCAHLHHSIEHEQAMVHVNVWVGK